MLQLLLRFYEPTRGRILIDGIDIRELGLKALRGQMALVQQEPALFDASIR